MQKRKVTVEFEVNANSDVEAIDIAKRMCRIENATPMSINGAKIDNWKVVENTTGSYFAERPIGNAECVTFDHSVTKFEVEIRAMSVGPNDVKDLLQKKYEVLNVSEVDRKFCYKV